VDGELARLEVHVTIYKTKLVRDGYPVYPACTLQPITPAEHQALLRQKLIEEVMEIVDNPWDLDEYADVLEVFESLLEVSGIDPAEVRRRKEAKAEQRGRFLTGRLVWTSDPDYGPRR
jgi:predicted house-cleaning noncanonical NTP pyrophosphatase (MazG superfamily)